MANPPEKLSLYKQASPLERGNLIQSRQQVPLSETPPMTTPTSTTVTEVWSSHLPEVQVVRHTSPKKLLRVATGGGRFSSDFTQFQPPSREATVREQNSPALPPPPTTVTAAASEVKRGAWGGRGGGGEEGGGRGEEIVKRSASDTTVTANVHPHPPSLIETPTQPWSAGRSSLPEDNSVRGAQKKKPRKTKGRVIPSRYMSSMTTKTTPTGHKTLSIKPPSTLNKTHQASMKTTRSVQKPAKKDDDSFKKPTSLPRTKSGSTHPPPLSAISSTLSRQPFTPSAFTSSTPKVGSSSSQHTFQESFMDLSSSSSTRTAATVAKHKSKAQSRGSSQSGDMETELLYCRLLQATYLDVKSAKALREQEDTAKTQLQVLWTEVEERRRECAALRQELETAHRTAVLSTALDVQVNELSPVISNLPRLQQHHSALSIALDITRHELPTSGLLPVTEQQLEAELTQSERLLADVVTSIRHKAPTVVSFADSTEAAVNTLDKEFQELEKCWKELSAAVRLQTQETSLTFERKQRQRTLNPPQQPHPLTNTCTE